MKAVFLDFDTVSAHDLDTRSIASEVDELTLHDIDEPKALDMMRGKEVVLLNKVCITQEMMAATPSLKLIALAATGTDNVDLKAARELNIAVCNVRAYCTASVAQHAWSLILSLNQHIHAFDRLARDGSWRRDESGTVLAQPIQELAGRTFGVVGWGNLGKGTAAIAQAFGMRVLIAEGALGGAEPGRTPLPQLLASSDVVSLHCPLTPKTRGLMGEEELKLMKSTALLINTARGGLIDSRALARALKAGTIAGAGLDVMAQEPPDPNDPLLDPSVPNLLITPHVAWAAREARQRCLDEIAANIRDFKAGGERGRVV